MRRMGAHVRRGLDRTYIGGIERVERNVSLLNIKKKVINLFAPFHERKQRFFFGEEFFLNCPI